MGIRSGARFAAIMPATCAMARTSPFFEIPCFIILKVSGFTNTLPVAVA